MQDHPTKSAISRGPWGPRVLGLRCRECGAEYEVVANHVCYACFGPLDVVYDYEAIGRVISRQRIEAGPPSMWRYRDLLPVEDEAPITTLGEGFTPLVRADRLGAELGLRNLYLKNDSMNPTNSFKDRVVSVAVSWARAHGYETIGCASTGNLANSVAAYAARAGLECFVFVPEDTEEGKLVATGVFEPNVVAVQGSYDDVNRLCSQLIEERDWAFCNINVRPYYAEGSKTLTFETVEQLGWRLPDEIVIPIASGCQFVRHRRAIQELLDLRLVDGETPRLTGAQAAGCAPVYNAWSEGTDRITPVRPQTIARSIAIGNPSDGTYVVRIARETGGLVEAVSEEEIVAAMRLLARTEGIFTETAGGTTIATLAKLAAEGVVRRDERVVVYVTGHGLKTIEAIGDLGPTATIKPTMDAFADAVDVEGEA
jgi:threonine synthase